MGQDFGICGLGELSESRIVADYTDYADFGDFCLPSVFVRRARLGTLPVSERKLKVYGTN